jgi:hypothetical protein
LASLMFLHIVAFASRTSWVGFMSLAAMYICACLLVRASTCKRHQQSSPVKHCSVTAPQ